MTDKRKEEVRKRKTNWDQGPQIQVRVSGEGTNNVQAIQVRVSIKRKRGKWIWRIIR